MLKKAEEADKFRAKMEEAKVEAQNAIDLMYDAEREAELARLEAASAKATLDAIEKHVRLKIMQKKKKKSKERSEKSKKRCKKEARIASSFRFSLELRQGLSYHYLMVGLS